jgi:hypothetical protein
MTRDCGMPDALRKSKADAAQLRAQVEGEMRGFTEELRQDRPVSERPRSIGAIDKRVDAFGNLDRICSEAEFF